MTTTMTITEREIEALRDAAGAHGDLEQVAICDQALAGDMHAWRECERVIADARAMSDSDKPFIPDLTIGY